MIERHFDSNVLIDCLSGAVPAIAAIYACDRRVISKIVEMEVMVGCKYHNAVPKRADGRTPDEHHPDFIGKLHAAEKATLSWITSTFTVLSIDDATAACSVLIRKQTHKSLPDTVIHATALMAGKPLMTRNVSDFPVLNTQPAGCVDLIVIDPYANGVTGT